MGYSIGQVAKKTGLTTHTLRYYEKSGLLPFIRKSSSGLRVFSEEDLKWLSLIECLKETGMPLKGIKQYIDWSAEGNSTLEKRLKMFEQHKVNIDKKIALLEKNKSRIEYKIGLYKRAVKFESLEKVLEEEKKKKKQL